MTLYLEVSTDKYELPVAVAESVKELSKLRGVSIFTIYNAMRQVRSGITNKSKYIKVEVQSNE